MYIRVSEGFTKNMLVKEEELSSLNYDPNKDYYVSIFRYNEEQYKQFLKTKSVAGITDVTTNLLVFDFDDKESLIKAKTDAEELISRLLKDGIPENSIAVEFSGNKGFHVTVFTKENLTVNQLKNIVQHYSKDLTSLDKKIYDPARVLRMTYTKHPKTGLFKIPFVVSEFFTLSEDDVKERAKSLDSVGDFSYTYTKLPSFLKSIPDQDQVESKEEIRVDTNKTYMPNFLDLSRKPRWMSEAKFALQEGFFVEGERNQAFMILAATYKSQGFPQEITYRMLKGVAEIQAKRNNAERYPDSELWNNIIKTVYSPNWKGGTYSVKDTPLLQEVTKRLNLKVQDNEDSVVNIGSLHNLFRIFTHNIEQNTLRLGIPEIDKNIRVTTSMLVGLLAAPSAGKTTLALNILNQMSLASVKSLFFSLDMSNVLIYQKLVQKHFALTSNEVFSLYKNLKEGGTYRNISISKIENVLEQNYKNVSFSFKSGVTVEDIKDIILRKQLELGEKISFVCIDYLECISSDFSDPTAASAHIAQSLKDLANELDITILLLLQPQKHAGDPSEPLLSMRNIKGSSVIEQACSVIFTLWRPLFSPIDYQDDRYISIAVVKNRMGTLGAWDFNWNGLTGEITSLSDEDRLELKELLVRKEREKQAKERNNL